MPVQYFYPIGDDWSLRESELSEKVIAVPTTPSGYFFQTIDEGVSFSDDSDYVYLKTTTGNNFWGPVFDFSSLSVAPSSVIVNIRHSGSAGTDEALFNVGFSLQRDEPPELSGNIVEVLQSGFIIPDSTSGFITSTFNITQFYQRWSNYGGYERNEFFNSQGQETWSGIVGNGNFAKSNPPPFKTDFLKTNGNFKISSMEIVFSGNTVLKSGLPMYLYGSAFVDNLNKYFSSRYVPVGDVQSQHATPSPSISSGLYYRRVNSGILTPVDSENIYFTSTWGTIDSGDPSFYKTFFNLSGMPNNPSAVILRIRHSGLGNHAGTINLTSHIGNTFSPITLSGVGGFITETFDITSGCVWNDMNKSGLLMANVLIPFMAGPFTGQPSVSELEIEVSGLVGNSLYTQGHLPHSGNLSLYTFGAYYKTNNLPLYTNGNVSKSLDLYISGLGFKTGQIPLFIKSYGTSYSGQTNIFLKGWNSGDGSGNGSGTFSSNNVPLFMRSFLNSSGNFPMIVRGPDSYSPSGGFPLFIPGPTPTFIDSVNGDGSGPGGIVTSLFLQNKFGSGNRNVNLIIANFSNNSGNIPLFINNQQTGGLSGILPLFLGQKGNVSYSSGTLLTYIKGGNSTTIYSQIPLYLSGNVETASSINKNLNMFMYVNDGNYVLTNPSDQFLINPIDNLLLDGYGGNYQSMFRTLGMVLKGGITSSTPLFIRADGDNPNNNNHVNLFVKNSNETYNTKNLYLHNTTRSMSGGLKLLIGGAGENDGYYVGRNNIPLYLGKNISSVDNRLGLFLKTTETLNNNLGLSISGGTYSVGNLNLAMPNNRGVPSGILWLKVHGF